MSVEETVSPSTLTDGSPTTTNPCRSPRRVSRSRLPSRPRPNDQLNPTHTSRNGRAAAASDVMNVSGGVAANVASKGSARQCVAPRSAKNWNLWRVLVSRRGAASGRSTRSGCGSNVTTTAAAPGSRRLSATARPITA